jgi:hypothetical protein
LMDHPSLDLLLETFRPASTNSTHEDNTKTAAKKYEIDSIIMSRAARSTFE